MNLAITFLTRVKFHRFVYQLPYVQFDRFFVDDDSPAELIVNSSYTIFDWTLMQRRNMATSSWASIGLMSRAETSWMMESLCLSITPALLVTPDDPTGYAEVSESYVGILSTIVGYYFNNTD